MSGLRIKEKRSNKREKGNGWKRKQRRQKHRKQPRRHQQKSRKGMKQKPEQRQVVQNGLKALLIMRLRLGQYLLDEL